MTQNKILLPYILVHFQQSISLPTAHQFFTRDPHDRYNGPKLAELHDSDRTVPFSCLYVNTISARFFIERERKRHSFRGLPWTCPGAGYHCWSDSAELFHLPHSLGFCTKLQPCGIGTTADCPRNKLMSRQTRKPVGGPVGDVNAWMGTWRAFKSRLNSSLEATAWLKGQLLPHPTVASAGIARFSEEIWDFTWNILIF